ncbi:DUF2867 domain-containing protein [Streptomyces sp. NPDC005481]|uniref:DUF2867 domain-containing protein n=1 Tax=Streptomyces sp. NPDC005481 TaxID=3154881 RepID=UPI0033A3A7C2
MQRVAVRRNVEPVVAAAHASLGRYDHVDTVAVDVEPGVTAVDFTRRMLGSPPRWVRTLLVVRDAAVAPFGLKQRERGAPAAVAAGAKIGPMRLLSVSDEEVLAGDNDKHLSFRCSFAVRQGPRGPEAVCTTVVRFHRRAGRLYFRAIEPFHHAVVAGLVRRGARGGEPGETTAGG